VNNTDAAYGVWFQVNNNNSSEYPGLHDADPGKMFEPGESEQKISGTAKIKVNNGASLYLSTHNTTADVKIYVKNFKCLVTYMTSGKPAKQKKYPTNIFTVGEAGTCGIQIGDGELKPFEIIKKDAADVVVNSDGSVQWISTAIGGGAGGVSFYIKEDKSEINIANYESIELEFVYSPITGKWSSKARNPEFCLRILPWDATGLFGGAIDLEYFPGGSEYGTYKGTISIPTDFKEKIINSSDEDCVLGFGLKFNDWKSNNSENTDQIKVQLKKVKFNKKAGAPADQPFDDGLTADQRGTVKSIYYPTKDYTATTNALTYNKHAWVYLPAGYDAADTETKYPVFILLHGHGQNESSWGMSNIGRGGKIKCIMDKGMANSDIEKFILVCATGVASSQWGSGEGGNGAGNDFNGFNAFGGELKNDLLPYIRENYNVAEGRDNVALAGLSMGGGQTMNIGIGQCLDEISWFGAFSAALFRKTDEKFNPLETWEEAIYTYMTNVETAFPDLDLNYLYMICGDADTTSIDGVKAYANYINTTGWDKVGGKERFTYVEVPGGTHDFPVWFQGFDEFSRIVFKKNK
jgi:enterochelin esterase-like enzyme